MCLRADEPDQNTVFTNIKAEICLEYPQPRLSIYQKKYILLTSTHPIIRYPSGWKSFNEVEFCSIYS